MQAAKRIVIRAGVAFFAQNSELSDAAQPNEIKDLTDNVSFFGKSLKWRPNEPVAYNNN